ncbi:MAG: crotonase/enoyl-CoA hydratase family protein [Alphaproteobacteria bacterium]
MTDRVSITVKDHIADVKLVRTDKMNALDAKMFDALADAGAEVAANPDVRCVVLSGEGRAFCAGLDVSSMGQSGGSGSVGGNDAPDDGLGRLERRVHGDANHPQQAAWVWRDMPKPVIAAVHGVAFGGGFQVALGADIRIVAPGTRFSVMEMKWGLVPDMAGMALLRSLVRDDVARELTYTARIFDADEAKELGLVTKLSETPYDDAMEMAAYIAGRNPDAITAAKRLLNNAHDLTAAEVLLEESREQDKIIGSANQMEAVMAELEKRPAKFG